MNISVIIMDSLRYPFSDLKKILIIGVFVLITFLSYINTQYHGPLGVTSNIGAIWAFFIFTFLIGLLVKGYMFRIIRSSLGSMNELPELNNWSEMFISGIKVFIVSFVYLLPGFLIIIIASYVSNPSIIFNTILSSLYLTTSSSAGSTGLFAFTNLIGPWFSVAYLYIFIINSISFIALATMADNNGKLSSAFQIERIFNKIGSIGWKNFIVWYLATFIIYMILGFISDTILTIIFS